MSNKLVLGDFASKFPYLSIDRTPTCIRFTFKAQVGRDTQQASLGQVPAGGHGVSITAWLPESPTGLDPSRPPSILPLLFLMSGLNMSAGTEG